MAEDSRRRNGRVRYVNCLSRVNEIVLCPYFVFLLKRVTC